MFIAAQNDLVRFVARGEGEPPPLAAMKEKTVPLLLFAPEAAKSCPLSIFLKAIAVELPRRRQRQAQVVAVPAAPLGKMMASRQLQPHLAQHGSLLQTRG
jgi:hypothetical protein